MRADKRLGLSTAALLIAVLAGQTRSTWALETDQGRYAARLVDQARYMEVHSDLLFTHNGDDRGLGWEHDAARENIASYFAACGLTTILDPFSAYGYPACNVIAELPGTTRPSDIYIIGAHYDSFSYQTYGSPGADDNASGVAAVLEIARLISGWQSEATIRLIAFDREEWGLLGSDHYAGQHATENIKGMLSLDMLAYRATPHNYALVSGRPQSNTVKYDLANALLAYGGIQASVENLGDYSDHAPFEWRGFRAAWLGEFDIFQNPYFHTLMDSLDVPGYIDYEYATKLTRGVMGWLVDRAGVTPRLAGDLNCDATVDSRDINPFVLALLDPAAYQSTYPDCRWGNGDYNQNGTVDFGDIDGLVAAVLAPCRRPQPQAKLRSPGPPLQDYFGSAVAAGDDLILVGAGLDDAPEWMSGSVYVFEPGQRSWAPTAKLTPQDAAVGDQFGLSLALSGNVMLIGAPGKDELGEDSGVAYVFERTTDSWTQTAKLIPEDGSGFSYFGQAVSIDGYLAVVGAPGESSAAFYAGAAYVFERLDGAWTQVAKLTAWDAAEMDFFGTSVAVSGGTIAVGACQADGLEPGSVYLFEQVQGVWTPNGRLSASDEKPGDFFGRQVALDGDYLVVTGHVPDGWGTGRGSAYVFERIGGGWTQAAKLGTFSATSCLPVAINGDTILLGRDGGDLPAGAGLGYLFQRQAGTWQPVNRLTAWDGSAGDRFGAAVALTTDRAVLGALADYQPDNPSGSVYVFELEGTGIPWIAQQPQDASVQVGGAASFSVSATGPGPLSYRWRKNGLPLRDGGHITGARSATLTIKPAMPEDAGVYDVTVSGLCGSVASDAATLTVLVECSRERGQ